MISLMFRLKVGAYNATCFPLGIINIDSKLHRKQGSRCALTKMAGTILLVRCGTSLKAKLIFVAAHSLENNFTLKLAGGLDFTTYSFKGNSRLRRQSYSLRSASTTPGSAYMLIEIESHLDSGKGKPIPKK